MVRCVHSTLWINIHIFFVRIKWIGILTVSVANKTLVLTGVIRSNEAGIVFLIFNKKKQKNRFGIWVCWLNFTDFCSVTRPGSFKRIFCLKILKTTLWYHVLIIYWYQILWYHGNLLWLDECFWIESRLKWDIIFLRGSYIFLNEKDINFY